MLNIKIVEFTVMYQAFHGILPKLSCDGKAFSVPPYFLLVNKWLG